MNTISKQYVSSHTTSCYYTENFSFQEGQCVSDHGHEFFEIGITLEGNAIHTVHTTKSLLTSGSVYCIPMGTTHKIEVQTSWNVQNIYLFPTTFASFVLDKPSSPYNLLRYFLVKICGTKQDALHYRLSENTLQAIVSQFALLESYPFSTHDSYALYRENCLMNVFLLLAEEYTTQFGKNFLSFDTRILQINEYILTHLEQPTKQLLSELSTYLSLNAQYINRIVKNELGIPISQYITQCKIEKGVQMLYSGASISSIADALGYYDQSHFHKYFKKQIGISPTSFQKNL